MQMKKGNDMQRVDRDQQVRRQINSNRNYGSLTSKFDPNPTYGSNKCRSDEHINYQRQSNVYETDEQEQHVDENLFLSSSELFVEQSVCQCSYIVEPVAFIQNLAASIMGFSLGQFIYNRIFTRLLDEASRQANDTNSSNMSFSYNLLSELPVFVQKSSSLLSNQTNNNSCAGLDPTNNNNNNNNGSQLLTLLMSHFSTSSSPYLPSTMHSLIHHPHPLYSAHFSLSPSDIDRIRTQAQEQTANLYFISSLFSGIPVIIMTNLLGANCSNLGRKTLMLIYLFLMSLKFLLIFLQCVYPEWPDWLFYVGAFIEGICGSGGIFYLALYCYISDYTSQSSRSFRITFLNNMNSLASLCVTFACGYVIKFYGYFYLFLTSAILMFIAFVYTVFLIPESLRELKSVSYWQRLKRCSIKRVFKSYQVYFNNKNITNQPSLSKEQQNSRDRDEEDIDQNVNETSSLLERSNTSTAASPTHVEKQTLVLFLIIMANFIYVFGTNGISSIFTLFIMNAPYCFDSIAISHYSIFSTVFALFMSLFVSKFIRVNDVIICIISVGSYFASVFCYIYGSDVNYIYLGAIISSIAGLEYGYVRSIVSKSVEKHEVSDALSFILIIDTFIAVVSTIIFPILYSKVVSSGIAILFKASNAFILAALILHVVNYCLYEPVKHEKEKSRRAVEAKRETKYVQRNLRAETRQMSYSEDNLLQMNRDSMIQTAENANINSAANGILNPMHQSLIFSTVEYID